MDIEKLQENALEIRKGILKQVFLAKSGHPGGALGLADIYTYLYFEKLNTSLIKRNSKNREFIFVSNGHTCPVLYATLAQKGFFPKKELENFRKFSSFLQGHPHFGGMVGVENSGGPLGQGISQAVGLSSALLREEINEKLNLPKKRVYCFVGDGELNEGQCWEAILYAGANKLSNFVLIVDKNNIQIDGNTQDVLNIGDLQKKLSSFGFSTFEFNGNDFGSIDTAFKNCEKISTKPCVLIANTIPGKGVSFMEDDFHWHGKAPNQEQFDKAMGELK